MQEEIRTLSRRPSRRRWQIGFASSIARRIGNAKAVRAVGAANGKNPISIVAACHRVIGSNGKLTGFAGGLATKQLLLQMEACDGNFFESRQDFCARQTIPEMRPNNKPGYCAAAVMGVSWLSTYCCYHCAADC